MHACTYPDIIELALNSLVCRRRVPGHIRRRRWRRQRVDERRRLVEVVVAVVADQAPQHRAPSLVQHGGTGLAHGAPAHSAQLEHRDPTPRGGLLPARALPFLFHLLSVSSVVTAVVVVEAVNPDGT